MIEKPKFARPMIVARPRSLAVSQDKLMAMPATIAQIETIRQFACDLGRDLKPIALIRRTQSKFDPSTNQVFQNVFDSIEDESEMVLIDDYLRLIDFRNYRLALDQGSYLRDSASGLYSILHASFVKNIPQPFMLSAIKDRARQSELRSRGIKKGLKETSELFGSSKPTRDAISKGAEGKSRHADVRALALLPEVEKIRHQLPETCKDSHKALADALNEAGVRTVSGKGKWQGALVKRLLDRIERLRDAESK